MGKSAGSPPQAPDPQVTIPMQGAENRKSFDYALNASRINQYGPTGSQVWKKTPGFFDEAGYNAAMADYARKSQAAEQLQQAPQGRYVQNGDSTEFVSDAYRGGNGSSYSDFMQGGYVPPATPIGPAPNRNSFMSGEQWSLYNELSPEEQKLFDTNQSSKLTQAQLLDALSSRLKGSLGQEIDYSSLPENVNSIGMPDLQAPGMRQINRGEMPSMAGLEEGLNSKLGAYSDRIGALDPLQFNKEAADALYGQSTRYLDPQVKEQQQALEARLAEQGFVPGTPGYQQAMRNFMDTNARSYADARDRAITLGTSVGRDAFNSSLGGIQAQIAAALSGAGFGLNSRNAQAGLQGQDFSQQQALANMDRQQGLDANAVAERLFGARQTSANFQNQQRDRMLAELLQRRAIPLNELNAVRSGTQVNVPGFQAPQMNAPQGLGTPDVMGAYNNAYQGQVDAYNAQVGSDNAMLGGLGGIINAGLANPQSVAQLFAFLSDADLKENAEIVGQTPGGANIYEYDIFGRRERGVMAQELLQTQPEAVYQDPESGFFMVDYSKVK